MPTQEWLKKEFSYGYDSGNIEDTLANVQREKEESRIGGSYNEIAEKLLKKHIQKNSKVLELGPGRGSWSKVILNILEEEGSLTTLDFQDVSQWLNKSDYKATLCTHQINSNSYNCLENDTYDVFWSFGVLCHNNIDSIYQILHNIAPKMKKGAILIHQYADWDKLENFGWKKGAVPEKFKKLRDDEIWWPRNNKTVMKTILEANGYEIINIDCELTLRDSIFISIKK